MRIVFCVGSFPELSETFVLNQIEGLVEARHDVHVYAVKRSNYDGSKIAQKLEQDGKVHYLDLPSNTLMCLLFCCRLFWQFSLDCSFFLRLKIFFQSFLERSPERLGASVWLSNQSGIDLFVCHFGSVGNMFIDLRSFHKNAGFFVFFHGNDMSEVVQRCGTNVYSKLFSVADLLLPISEHWKEALKNMGAPTGKLKVFRMGIDPRAYNFHMRSIDTARPINILTIGRLVPKKGYTDSLKAIALLGDSLDVTYTIIGSGPCETEVRTVIRELNLDDRVKMMGSVPPEKVGSYFDKADLFLLPSKTDAVSGDKEGVPVVLMEAMASGLPVVSTYHSGIPELVKDGETGWLVPESSPELIAKSILAIVHNSQEIARRSEFARSKILKDFDIANLVKQLNELCEQNG